MLTPDRIKEKTFQTSGRGSYRAEDVDSFFREVSASYEQMFKENTDLIKKISVFAKKIEEYRADEDSLKMALLNAQKLADQITAEARENAEKNISEAKTESDALKSDAKAVADEITAKAKAEADALVDSAKAEAEKILADANLQAKDILGNVNRKVTHETLVYDMVKKEASEFKAKLVAMYKDHINLINQLPEIVNEQLDSQVETNEEVEETVVIEEETPVVVIEESEDIVEVEETVEDVEETDDTVEEAEETFEEIQAVEDDEPVVVEETPAKKPFKLDLSKIDFADDEKIVAEPVVSVVEETEETDDEDNGPAISFKNFFKKK